MTPAFHFDIVTLDGAPYSGQVISLMVPGEKGFFGVLANHARLISTCAPGKLKIKEESGAELWFRTGKGYFEVAKNQAVLLANTAEKLSTS